MQRPDKNNNTKQVPVLSEREQQVAALACDGLSNKAIARKLGVSEGTIKCHLNSIYTKLGVRSRYALLAVFVRSAAD